MDENLLGSYLVLNTVLNKWKIQKLQLRHLDHLNKPDKYSLNNKMEKAMAPKSGTIAWKIPWMEEPGRLQSMGLPRVEHD